MLWPPLVSVSPFTTGLTGLYHDEPLNRALIPDNDRTWYLYYGTGEEPQVILTLWSLLAALFGLGLSLGVVVAVGMLLIFQVFICFYLAASRPVFVRRLRQS